MREKLVPHLKLRNFGYELFKTVGVSRKISTLVVNGLVDTSLRGVDSHGIRLIPHYIRATQTGRIKKNPKFIFTKTAPSCGIFDADDGFGIAAGIEAMMKATMLAKKTGLGAVSVRNSSHFGAAAIYTLLAAKKNMIGFAFTNVDSLVVPYGGRKPYLGTNPISFAAPMTGEEPLCLDMATSQISWNKILVYKSKKKALDFGWAVDKNGKITTDPMKAVGLYPIGGYKGYGLALAIEILCSLLSGMPYGRKIVPMYPLTNKKRRLGHFFMAIDISRYIRLEIFKRSLRDLCDALRKKSVASNDQRVMVAGDPEKEVYKIRIKTGIPISNFDYQEFKKLISQYNIKFSL